MILYIKHMACESCKIVVKEELEKLGFVPVKVELGMAEIKKRITQKQKEQFANNIKKAKLEVVGSEEDILVDKIKTAVAEYIEQSGKIKMNLSEFLRKKIHHDYAYLSAHYSEMQRGTIEQFMIHLKIEKVKEMLTLYNMTLTQIAYKLNYSSVAHLSGQFKKVTGIPATQFKHQKTTKRKTIQEL